MGPHQPKKPIVRAILASLVLVASLVAAGQSAQADETILSLDFAEGHYEPLVPSGDPTLEVVELEGEQVLSVQGRDADYVGVSTPAGGLEPGATYAFAVDFRLADGVPNSQARLVGVPGYGWIGNTEVTSETWTTISGEWTVPADATMDERRVYVGTADLPSEEAYDYYLDNFTVTRLGGGGAVVPTSLTNDFETELAPWGARGSGAATATLTTAEFHDGQQAALISGRDDAWNGLAASIAGVLDAGSTYQLAAAVKLPADSTAAADIRVSVERAEGVEGERWVTLTTVEGVGADEWRLVDIIFTVASEASQLYFETAEGTADFLVDSIVVSGMQGEVQDLTPILETVDFPIGVAIDERETEGTAAELLLRHFNQITPENHMKPENWYNEAREFTPDPQAAALMDFARENSLGLYGHTLVWHSQVPEWFFQDEAGEPLSPADSDVLDQRLREHIFNVAQYLSDGWGLFGSDTNPLVAWDVVNEVISDDARDDGLRRSEWYRIMGPDYLDLAFRYAEEAFNELYADPASERPVALFINDYNTEQGGKQDRYLQVVEALLARDVPLDGVGHQFHLNLSTPIDSLDATLARFAHLPVTQAVTELDVTIGTTSTQALLVEQGHFYKAAFDVFRDYSDELFSVTIWGLTDNRSWRAEQWPLAFDGTFQAKAAYYGIVDSDELPPIIRRGVAFEGSAPLTEAGATDDMWADLPLFPVGSAGGFQLRWAPDGLTVYVMATGESDEISFRLNGADVALPADAVTLEAAGDQVVLAHVPAELAAGAAIDFNVLIRHGANQHAWNPGGTDGALVLVEELSVTEASEAQAPPVVDGLVDEAWADAEVLSTDVTIEGAGDGATGDVRTLWHGNQLYVLVDVTDAEIDLTASNPWEQDSVELFIDISNAKAGSYRSDDMQIRINVDNDVSFGTGDEALQRSRVTSATQRTDAGYRVEAAVELADAGGLGTIHGFDVQVNDAAQGARTGVKIWADPTGLSYQSTERWGVARLVAADVAPVDPTPTPEPPYKPRDLYEIPGYHNVNGRQWFTNCESYSQTVRCWTYIWGTEVKRDGNRFVGSNGWVFNNLTYLPLMKRAEWAGNPLAQKGSFTSAGRQWRTECDTAATGRGGCRSYIHVNNVVHATQQSDGSYRYHVADMWRFNNMVRFKQN